MKFKLIFLFFSLLTLATFPQEIDELLIVTDEGTINIPAFLREGTIYSSIVDFAEALKINFFANEKTGKVELKSNYMLLKSTPKNSFLIVTPRSTGVPKVYQLPTSSYLRNGETYIPIAYCLDPLEMIVEKKLTFETPNKFLLGERLASLFEGKDWFFDNPNLPPTIGYGITGLTINEKANGTLIRIHSKTRIPSYYSSYEDGELKIIFRKVNAEIEKVNKEKVGELVKNIQTRNVGPDTEFIFNVGEQYSTNEVMNAPGGNDILITIHNKVFSYSNTKRNIDKWSFDAVVIDAGHGGKDPGAIGVDKIKEKEITLAVALKLGEILKKEMPDVKTVYTRKDDNFIDLYKRGKIANENNGKLFISIHCNVTKKKPSDANGTEVYLLRPGRTTEAIEIAETENSVIEYEENPDRYEKLTDENFILVSMAHSSYMKYSEKFAELLDKEFATNLKLNTRGVKQAGFYVLVGASMPSVLIETGFISNKEEAKFLKSKKGQQQVAESIFSAIKTYRSYYEKEMEAEL
ncbi:MAG: N-acetylmuramoyl-L-alanine amidase [Ignavibacteriaceae bacterium]|nr:N-acetylmuramoyl-L-alanine amidase [Ignavibacteria bacterium]NNJ53169.1 N-acetylmuramoyl-L-alanine amidase [Ignavibacteriaceae bacterium]NNL21032.1 N-acetylmuramoyl-L-alanine amidase [Ignavibacteriaceae bacterium]